MIGGALLFPFRATRAGDAQSLHRAQFVRTRRRRPRRRGPHRPRGGSHPRRDRRVHILKKRPREVFETVGRVHLGESVHHEADARLAQLGGAVAVRERKHLSAGARAFSSVQRSTAGAITGVTSALGSRISAPGSRIPDLGSRLTTQTLSTSSASSSLNAHSVPSRPTPKRSAAASRPSASSEESIST